MSLAGPKARPTGVVDGCLVDNPEPGLRVEAAGTRSKCVSRGWLSVLGGEATAAPLTSGTFGGSEAQMEAAAKSRLRSVDLTVPQTDTGRQVEDTKAREITPVKELGKLTP